MAKDTLLGSLLIDFRRLDMDSSTHAICMLCRLLLDYTVVNSNDLVGAIGDALASLLGTIPEETFDKQVR